MRRNPVHALAAGASLLIAIGCGTIDPIAPPAPAGGGADFSTYVALGTSITAGVQSGGLVDRHQSHSYATLFARQTGAATFTIPTVSADGIPPLLRIVSLSPLLISNAGRPQGVPTNSGQVGAYHNLGVPYAILFDVADSSLYYTTTPERTGSFTLVARHRGTLAAQASSLAPTFMTLEYGANEVLGPAIAGSGTVNPPPATFAALLAGTLNLIQAAAPNARLALINVPDVTSLPFVTTFPPFTRSLTTGGLVPLIGPGGTPLGAGDHVLLTAGPSLAAGDGIPVGGYNYVNPAVAGNGNPLSDAVVLSATETASVRAAVTGYNDAIAAAAGSRGLALVDLHGLVEEAATVGLEFQGTRYTTAFVTGGLIGLDGIHPNDLAHGMLCNALIDAVNVTYGARIPHVNLSDAATISSSRLRPAGLPAPLYPVIEDAEAYYRTLFPIVPTPAAAVAARGSLARPAR